MNDPKSLNSSGSGFYEASDDECIHDNLVSSPKINNFIPLIKAKSEQKPKKTKPLPQSDSKANKKFGAGVDLREKNFSVKNDLFFGWKPNVGIKNPFPLFYNDKVGQNLEHMKIPIYKGFRPAHSYRLHEFYSGDFKYPYNNKSFRLYMNKEIKSLLKMNIQHDLPIYKPQVMTQFENSSSRI